MSYIDFHLVMENNTIEYNNAPCFIPIAHQMDASPKKGKYLVYFPKGVNNDRDIEISDSLIKWYYKFLKKDLGWKGVLPAGVNTFLKTGVKIPLSIPSVTIVGIASAVRYIHERPAIVKTTRHFVSAGISPKASFFLAHGIEYTKHKYYIHYNNNGHCCFRNVSISSYKHFSQKFNDLMLEGEPWTVKQKYEGVHSLFGGNTSVHNTLEKHLLYNKSADPWGDEHKITLEDILRLYNNKLKPLEL